MVLGADEGRKKGKRLSGANADIASIFAEEREGLWKKVVEGCSTVATVFAR